MRRCSRRRCWLPKPPRFSLHGGVVIAAEYSATSTKADKFAAAFPDRFLEMGIAEQGMGIEPAATRLKWHSQPGE